MSIIDTDVLQTA